jgi:hypothetical protein
MVTAEAAQKTASTSISFGNASRVRCCLRIARRAFLGLERNRGVTMDLFGGDNVLVLRDQHRLWNSSVSESQHFMTTWSKRRFDRTYGSVSPGDGACCECLEHRRVRP